MHSRKVIRRLKQDGWHHVGTTGDHWHFKHPTKSGKVTIVHPAADLPVKTLRSIEKAAGIKLGRR